MPVGDVFPVESSVESTGSEAVSTTLSTGSDGATPTKVFFFSFFFFFCQKGFVRLTNHFPF